VVRACGRAAQVFIYAYGGRIVDTWWDKARGTFERAQNLRVLKLSSTGSQGAARLVQRTMSLDCTIQNGQIWLSDAEHSVEVHLLPLSDGANPSATC